MTSTLVSFTTRYHPSPHSGHVGGFQAIHALGSRYHPRPHSRGGRVGGSGLMHTLSSAFMHAAVYRVMWGLGLGTVVVVGIIAAIFYMHSRRN